MPKTISVDNDLLTNVINDVSKNGMIDKLTSKLMLSCVDTLEEAIKSFRNAFIEKATSILETNDNEILLPENTRFFRRNASIAMFVLEYKPSVRTMHFCESIEVNPSKKNWRPNYRLALPYIVLIPVFVFNGETPCFYEMCVAFRNESLKTIDDMLYHPILPNLGRPFHTSPFDPDEENGDILSHAEMVMCQGYADLQEENAFSVPSTNLLDMIKVLEHHFWTSHYTGELPDSWKKMQHRDAKHFGSLERWEKASLEDPLFVLDSPWVPAVRLKNLLDMLTAVEPEEGNNAAVILRDETSRYLTKIHDETWKKLSVQARKKDLGEAFNKRLAEILNRFASEISKGLLVVNNDTIRRTVQFAITQALKESVK